jgi:hypothetical protein
MKMNHIIRTIAALGFVASVTACGAADALSSITAGMSDLAVSSIQPTGLATGTQAKVRGGDSLKVTIVYGDTGQSTPAFQSKVCLTYYSYSTDCAIPVTDLATSGLAAKSTRSDAVSLLIPMGALNPNGNATPAVDTKRTWRVLVCADSKDVVKEGDEYNNCSTSDEVFVLPNFEQSCAGAPAISVGQTVSGSYSSTSCFIGAIYDHATVRSFVASGAMTRSVQLTVAAQTPSGYLDAAVLNDQGDVVATGSSYHGTTSTGKTLTLSAPIGVAGTYYIAVSAPAAFTLSVQ